MNDAEKYKVMAEHLAERCSYLDRLLASHDDGDWATSEEYLRYAEDYYYSAYSLKEENHG